MRLRFIISTLAAAVVAAAGGLAAMSLLVKAEQPSGLPATLEAQRGAIDDVLSSDRTDWQKALEVTALVKAATPPIYSGYFCDQYSGWLIELAGDALRLRMVTGMVDRSNRVDTHTTVEVWLPDEGRWVIVDPTFGGHFTVDGQPVGAHDLQRLLIRGGLARVRWVSSRTQNAAMLSEYAPDPTLLFRHIYTWERKPDGRTTRVETQASRWTARALRGPPPVYDGNPDAPRFPEARES